MKRNNLLCIFASLFIMLALPWSAVTFAKSASGMLVCMLLFFIVNPVFAIGVGCFTGRNLKAAWFQPILCAAAYLLGAWLFFDMGELSFLLYAAAYVILGYAAALLCHAENKT